MEQQLKQRLAGAIVLVSLAVIFIPVILEGPDDEWALRDHTIPAPPDLAYHAPRDLPLPPAQPPGDKPGSEVKAPAAPVKSSASVKSPASVKPAPAKPAKQPPAGQSLATGWYVQVGSFSQADNARRLRDRLRTDKHTAHLQAIGSGKGFRVLVGPSRSRTQAEKVQQKLSRSGKASSIIIEIGGQSGR